MLGSLRTYVAARREGRGDPGDGVGVQGVPESGVSVLREEGVPAAEVTDLTRRPLFMEVPLGAFAGGKSAEQIKTEMLLATSNEAGALQLRGRIAEQERIRQAEPGNMFTTAMDLYVGKMANDIARLVQLMS